MRGALLYKILVIISFFESILKLTVKQIYLIKNLAQGTIVWEYHRFQRHFSLFRLITFRKRQAVFSLNMHFKKITYLIFLCFQDTDPSLGKCSNIRCYVAWNNFCFVCMYFIPNSVSFDRKLYGWSWIFCDIIFLFVNHWCA